MSPDPAPKTAAPKPIRWWPAALIVFVASGAAVWARLGYEKQRQDQNILIAIVGIIGLFLLLLWCLFLSRLRWKIRWTVLGGAIAVILSLPALFRIRGVTGDLVPIPEWRWKRTGQASVESVAKPVLTRETSGPAVPSGSADYPQFLGPHRNATVEGSHLARNWSASPPVKLWQHAVGAGWSGFAVAGGRAITQEQKDDDEAVTCYDLISGILVWSYAYPAHFQSSLAGEGPRATPTISHDRVYTLGSTGILNCLGVEDGKPIWSKDIVKDNESKVNEWGISCSPLVVGDLVVVSAGGRNERSLVAYRVDTGAFVWGAGTSGAGYSSPFVAMLAGTEQIIIFNSGGIFAHSATNGKILWQYPWPGGHPHVAMPVVLPEDQVLISSGYGVGSELIKVKRDSGEKFSATRVWKSNRLKAKFTNVIYRDGFIYGLDDGILACLDAATGVLKWKDGRYGHGQEILAGEVLLVTAESGEVILVEPNPQELRELTRFGVFQEKTWNPPALAGQYLLVRNDKEAACFRLPVVDR